MDHVKPEVFCVLDRTLAVGDADDHVKVVLRAPGKPTVDIEVTAACAMGQDQWLVMGTQGGLSGTTKELCWRYFKPEELSPVKLDTRPTENRSYNRDSLRLYEESWKLETDGSSGQLRFYEELYDSIRHGRSLPVTPESVLKQIQVLDECRKQASA
jgi:predicted dehydrogenase